MIWKLLSRLASPGGPRACLSVLYFHRVLLEPDPMLPDEHHARSFAQLLDWLIGQFELLPLEEAVQRLGSGTLPAGAASITFDDGYRDNHDVAMPLLRQRGVPATFFVATGYLDGGIMWNDCITEACRRSPLAVASVPEWQIDAAPLSTQQQRGALAGLLVKRLKYLAADERDRAARRIAQALQADLPENLMMRPEHVRALADAGFGIGAHTRSHPILARLDDASARAEMSASRDDLQRITGRPVPLFAYPNGRRGKDYDQRHSDMLRDLGFKAALATDPGACTAASDPWALPRFTPWDRRALPFRTQLLANQLRARRRGSNAPPDAGGNAGGAIQ